MTKKTTIFYKCGCSLLLDQFAIGFNELKLKCPRHKDRINESRLGLKPKKSRFHVKRIVEK